ncbi:MAG: tRNA (adenosine(37)-N6)-threonylcarbamoyltransferase complex transferase subunit TsaD [Patescibacteria group bacterium]
MLILGIETSCDDTGIAIVEADERRSKRGLTRIFNIKSNIVSSQIKTHAPFGGVVPNLAAREHLKNIEPCLKTALKEANLGMKDVDLIAVTAGPGLIPSLLIGVNFAKALAYKYNKPIIGVNHIEAHVIAAILSNSIQYSRNIFPAVALVVSGGHTQLVLMEKLGKYRIIGETRDDAAGECFDKVAKLLRLSYPGGPAIAKEAAKAMTNDQFLISNQIPIPKLPRPMIEHKNYDFSFSGLKTAVLYLVRDIKQKYQLFSDRAKDGINIIPKICAEVQQAIIDVLIEKTLRAAKEYKAKTVILSGGVAANSELRRQFELKIKSEELKTNFLIPKLKLCTDNGAMIAITGYLNRKQMTKKYDKIRANANLRIG